MSFGERIKFRRGELKLSRGELAGRLGVSPSAVSNYENGLSFPKEDVMLRLFDSLETDPNQLFRDSFRGGGQALSSEEQTLLRKFRELSPLGRETVQSVTEALWACRQETSPASRRSGPRAGSSPCTIRWRRLAVFPQCRERILMRSPSQSKCRRRRNLPSASAGTLWPPIWRTARWRM